MVTGFTAVKTGVKGIEVLGIQVVLCDTEGFSEALVMDDFAGTQEFYGFADIRILDQTQDIVIGGAGFLLRSHILVQIRDDISLYLELTGIKGNTARCLRPDADSMIHVIVGEPAFLNLFHGEVTGQLVDDGGYHFQMPQFISPVMLYMELNVEFYCDLRISAGPSTMHTFKVFALIT